MDVSGSQSCGGVFCSLDSMKLIDTQFAGRGCGFRIHLSYHNLGSRTATCYHIKHIASGLALDALKSIVALTRSTPPIIRTSARKGANHGRNSTAVTFFSATVLLIATESTLIRLRRRPHQ